MSLQSANLNNGAKIFASTYKDEFLNKLPMVEKRNLFTTNRGLGALYYTEFVKNFYVGFTTPEPPNENIGTKNDNIDKLIKTNIVGAGGMESISLLDERLKRRINRLDIEWQIEKDFDESNDLKEFINNTNSYPHFIIRRASTAYDKFLDRYGINIKHEHFDVDGNMAIDYYDYKNRYVVSFDIFGITNDGRLQLYYVRWYDKPSLKFVEEELNADDNFVRLSFIIPIIEEATLENILNGDSSKE